MGSLHLYLWRRLVRDTGLAPLWRRLATAAIVALFLCVPVSALLLRLIDAGAIGTVVAWPAYLWLGFGFYLLLALWLLDAPRAVRWVRRRGWRGADRPEPATDEDRRRFLARAGAGVALTTATAASAFGMRTALGDIELTEVQIELANLPRELDGFSIVQLTDLHAGNTVGAWYIDDLVARANAARPDLVAVTGDLADGTPDALREVVSSLGELSSRHGSFFVTGNHEYYSGADAWLAEVESLGMRLLRNERVAIDEAGAGFDLLGVDDLQGEQFGGGHGANLDRALAGREAGRTAVLLAHQPRFVERAAGRVDLQISGHTHGGQLWPFHGAVWLQQRGLVGGRFTRDGTQLFVSRGCGYWGPPMRVGAPPELAKIILRSRRA